MNKWILAGLASCALLAAACGPPAEQSPADAESTTTETASQAAPAEPLDVRALSFPAAWLVEQVGGESVAVTNVLPAGEDAPHWSPPPELIADLQDADLIVKNGASFEKWTETSTLPSSKLVDTSQGLDLIEIEGVVHSHGAHGEHSHVGEDPHTWSDPLLFAEQAEAVKDALVAADPDRADAYERRYAEVRGELEALASALEAVGPTLEGVDLAANHPAFNYVARRMGVSVHSFELDPRDLPSDAQRSEVEAWVAEADNPVLLWEAEPTQEIADALPSALSHVVLDPLEQPGRDGEYDYLQRAETNLAIWRSIGSDG